MKEGCKFTRDGCGPALTDRRVDYYSRMQTCRHVLKYSPNPLDCWQYFFSLAMHESAQEVLSLPLSIQVSIPILSKTPGSKRDDLQFRLSVESPDFALFIYP